MALPKTFTGGERLFADDLNDNFQALDSAAANATNASSLVSGTVNNDRLPVLETGKLPAGVLIRIFNSVQTGTQTVTSATFIDVTNGAITITPLSASNNIYIIANSGDMNSVSALAEGRLQLLRDETVLRTARDTAPVADSHGNASIFIFDSPATVSAVTYKLQIARASSNVAFTGVNITVMEIAG